MGVNEINNRNTISNYIHYNILITVSLCVLYGFKGEDMIIAMGEGNE